MPHSTGDWGWDKGQQWHWEHSRPICTKGGWRKRPSPATTFQKCTARCGGIKGSAGHQQPRRPERGVPPSPVTTERKPRAWARTSTPFTLHYLSLSLPPPPETSLMHSLLLFSVKASLSLWQFPLFFTCLPTVLLYCAVYSALMHFQCWLGIIILTHGPSFEP